MTKMVIIERENNVMRPAALNTGAPLRLPSTALESVVLDPLLGDATLGAAVLGAVIWAAESRKA